VIQQARQAVQRSAVGDAGLDGVETRALKAGNQFGVERRRVHVPMVPASAESSVVNAQENQPSSAVISSAGRLTPDMRTAVADALAICRISDKEAAALMGIDPGRWSRQKAGVDGHFIQLDRLALLPESFHHAFARIYGGMVGVSVAHESIAALLVARIGELLVETNSLYAQLRALGRTA
jgi:hypothetical protein